MEGRPAPVPGSQRSIGQDLVCWLAVVLVGAVVARPSAEISTRDARGQTITDASDPLESSRSVGLNDAYKGGVVPVALMYDNHDVSEVLRPLRDAAADGEDEEKEEQSRDLKNVESTVQDDKSKIREEITLEDGKDTRPGIKNSKLLDIEARENDENAKFGLEIQSRNKVPSDEDSEKLEKPFVYNIQPLSFYSSETKEEENILNYINKIKEMRENQIKFEAEKKKNETAIKKHEDAIITESDSDLENRPIRRKIQHYETLIKPMQLDPQMYESMPQTGYPLFPASTSGFYQQSIPPQQFQQTPYPQIYQQGAYPQPQQHNGYPQAFLQRVGQGSYQNPQFSSVIYLPNIFKKDHETKAISKTGNTRILDDYFPILIQNPFNEIWAGITNIIEYGPAADVCRKNKKGREADDENETELDLSSQRVGFGGSKVDTWPKFTKLKVRKGGVAIAGPGGIATAGSGGTAIVGPGGTAYTTREGTAVVGPGGRVVHVPQFPIYAKNVDEVKPRDFVPPPGSQTVAEGPIIYYDNPLDTGDIPDPSFPF